MCDPILVTSVKMQPHYIWFSSTTPSSAITNYAIVAEEWKNEECFSATRPKPRRFFSPTIASFGIALRFTNYYVLVKSALSQNLLHFSFLSGTLLTLEPLDVFAPVD